MFVTEDDDTQTTLEDESQSEIPEEVTEAATENLLTTQTLPEGLIFELMLCPEKADLYFLS